MSKEIKLGTAPDEFADRDAVHVAVLPLVAPVELQPGQWVDINGQPCDWYDAAGIVDPYRVRPIQKDSRFYLCLKPGTVTGMRHHWRHPQVPEEEPKNAAEAKKKSVLWLRDYAVRNNPYSTDPDEAYEDLCRQLHCDEVYFCGRDLHSFADLPQPMELALHAHTALGLEIDWARFRFRCSC